MDELLSRDRVLAPLVAKAPGRRVPRTVDGAEFGVRAVLGQQVSTAAARTLAGRLVAKHGTAVEDPAGGLTHVFPSPVELVDVDESDLAMPRSRKGTFMGLVRALADGGVVLDVGVDWREARVRLAGVSGCGPWTVESIAMRALGDPDAFVATDLGVRVAAESLGMPVARRALMDRSRAWMLWRAYAVQYLWASGDHAINVLPAHDVVVEATS